MRYSSKRLIAAAAVLFAACAANAETVTVKTVKKTVRAPVAHEYQNVAGFKGRLRDPLYAFAAEPQAVHPRPPIIAQFPMPNTVWW